MNKVPVLTSFCVTCGCVVHFNYDWWYDVQKYTPNYGTTVEGLMLLHDSFWILTWLHRKLLKKLKLQFVNGTILSLRFYLIKETNRIWFTWILTGCPFQSLKNKPSVVYWDFLYNLMANVSPSPTVSMLRLIRVSLCSFLFSLSMATVSASSGDGFSTFPPHSTCTGQR